MIIECVNIESGIFFVWDYEDMRIDEARKENGTTNILMLKTKKGNIKDWIKEKIKTNKIFKSTYHLISYDTYFVPIDVDTKQELFEGEE